MTDDIKDGASGNGSIDGMEIKEIRIILQREEDRRVVRIGKNHRLIDLLRDLKMPIDGIIAFSEDVPIPLDDELWNLDELTIVTVASGG